MQEGIFRRGWFQAILGCFSLTKEQNMSPATSTYNKFYVGERTHELAAWRSETDTSNPTLLRTAADSNTQHLH